MRTATEPCTADDLFKNPRDGYRYELVKGELIEEPPAGNIHGNRTDVEEKVAEYLDAGTRAVWVVDPRRRTITVYSALTDIAILTENNTLEGRDILPEFSCPVAEIFA
jgi:Uma2 family endonuclease